MPKTKKDGNLLNIKKYEQYRTVDDLMEKSKPTEMYYILLTLSSIVVAAGLLLNNSAIVIGGMLITPMITPILLIGLGLSIGDTDLIKRTGYFVGKSILFVIASALLLGFVFEVPNTISPFTLDASLNGAVLYFLVALSAGFAASFSWIRKEISDILPGVAIAVALVPPLGLIGIGLADLSLELVRNNFFVFFFNLLGVLVGSILVFSLLKFYKVEKKVEEEVEEQKKEEKEENNEKEAKKEKDKNEQ